jgi:multidrug efflux pump subunit AcrA (membrane-fusion protein)
MDMKKRPAFVLGGLLIAASGVAAFVTLSLRTPEASAVSDPRQEPPLVRLATAARATGPERGFTGIVGARVQSNLGFRVPGKIVERLVNVGQQVKAGQPLMRIDETDLRLALTAKRNAVAAARATVVQLEADEQRYASLRNSGWVSRQRYEQTKAALDTATAQLAAAEAEASVAENEATYSVLVADADGTVVETLVEPGQVVSAGPWFGLPTPAPAKRSSRFPKRSGRPSARWPTPACMGATGAAIRPISGSCRTPPMLRHAPMRPAMCSTVTLRRRRLARR